MQRVVAAAIATAILAVAPAAQAQTTPESAPDSAQGQFSFHKTGEGFLRLDSKTGQVSFCSHKNHGWTCETIADERTALESEIARLQNASSATPYSPTASAPGPKSGPVRMCSRISLRHFQNRIGSPELMPS